MSAHLFSVSVIKCLDKKQQEGEETVYLAYNSKSQSILGKSRQELKQPITLHPRPRAERITCLLGAQLALSAHTGRSLAHGMALSTIN